MTRLLVPASTIAPDFGACACHASSTPVALRLNTPAMIRSACRASATGNPTRFFNRSLWSTPRRRTPKLLAASRSCDPCCPVAFDATAWGSAESTLKSKKILALGGVAFSGSSTRL